VANDSTCYTRALFPAIPVLIPAMTLASLRAVSGATTSSRERFETTI
jgi:hypothetical protein